MTATAAPTASGFACPEPGCWVFPYDTEADLAEHVASGRHSFPRNGSVLAQLAQGVHGPERVRPGDRLDGRFPTRSTDDSPTPKQVDYLRTLWTRLGLDLDAAISEGHLTLTRALTSKLIDTAREGVAKLADQAPASSPTAQPARTNRYAGRCRKCRQTVEAEAGLLIRTASGWATEHPEGSCPAPQIERADTPTVPAGHYAIDSTGSNDLAFYRVDHGQGAYEGQVFVKLIVGGHPDRNVARSRMDGILARIAADPDAAARYGRELGQCCRCNRTLTDEESRALGIGPECRRKASI